MIRYLSDFAPLNHVVMKIQTSNLRVRTHIHTQTNKLVHTSTLVHTYREKERKDEETACTIRARVYFIFARAGARQYFL